MARGIENWKMSVAYFLSALPVKKLVLSRVITKPTESHLYPKSSEKMSVKRAVLALSNSIAAAIRTCIKTKRLNSRSAHHPAKFEDFINRMARQSKY